MNTTAARKPLVMNSPEGCPSCYSLKIETVLVKSDRLVKRCECGHKWNEAKEEDTTMDWKDYVTKQKAAFIAASATLDAAHATYMNAYGRCAVALNDYSRGLDEYYTESARIIMHRLETDLLALGDMMRKWSRP